MAVLPPKLTGFTRFYRQRENAGKTKYLNFTKWTLENLRVSIDGKRDRWFDEQVKGLGIAIYPTGQKTFS